MLDEKEREQLHEFRKAERSNALGAGENPLISNVSVIKNKVKFSKAEQALLRSQALTVEDNPWQRIQFTNKFNSLAPTYDPTALSIISYQNNTLRQCIAAMIANVDGTGYEIKRKDGGKIAQVVSPDSPPPPPTPEAPPTPGTPFGMSAPVQGALPPSSLPKPPEKWEAGKPYPADEAAQPIMVDPADVAAIKEFWDEPYPGISFTTMRKMMRDHLETTGNAYLEIIRDASGKIALLNVMDSKLTRLLRHDDLPVAVTHTLTRGGKEQKATVLVHERRFVQIIGLNARFFKAYKASRELNAQTGIWQTDTSEVIPVEQRATEVLHFTADKDVLTPYGIPRWINQMPSVMGSRKAEELNLEFFESGGVPPLMILIQGGTLTATARRGLTEYLSGQAKFKQRGVVIEIAPSGGDLNSSAQVKTDVQKLGDQGGEDSKFEKYDEKCTQRVRSAFRLPAVLIGLEESYNYATVQTAVMMGEEQVFNPERGLFDETINSTIMKELDPTGTYVYESKRMTAKFLDEQIKALVLAKGAVDPKSFVDALNDVAGLDLKFDKALADAQNQAAMGGGPNAQQELGGPENSRMAGTGGGGAEASSGAGGGSGGFGGGGGGGSSAFGKSAIEIDPKGMSINPDNPANPLPQAFKVSVAKSGKIKKIDHTLLTDLASDWAGMMSGEKTFTGSNVQAMHSLIKSFTPSVQKLFADAVAMKLIKSTHDPDGVAELTACASDVLARIRKGGEAMPSPKDYTPTDLQLIAIQKYNPNHDDKGKFASGDSSGKSRQDVEGIARRDGRISSPPVRSDGRIELSHFSSREGLSTIDPKHYGSGLKGAEGIRKATNGKDFVNRSYYGIGVGQKGGYVREPGLGSQHYTTSVEPTQLYDFKADPDNLSPKDGNLSKYEKKIKSQGYTGYWVNHPQLGLVAAAFKPLTVEKHSIVKDDPYHEPAGSSKGGQFAAAPGGKEPIPGDPSTMTDQWVKTHSDGSMSVVESHQTTPGKPDKKYIIYTADKAGWMTSDPSPMTAQDVDADIHTDDDFKLKDHNYLTPKGAGTFVGDLGVKKPTGSTSKSKQTATKGPLDTPPKGPIITDKVVVVPGNTSTMVNQWALKPVASQIDPTPVINILEQHKLLDGSNQFIEYEKFSDGDNWNIFPVKYKDAHGIVGLKDAKGNPGYTHTYDGYSWLSNLTGESKGNSSFGKPSKIAIPGDKSTMVSQWVSEDDKDGSFKSFAEKHVFIDGSVNYIAYTKTDDQIDHGNLSKVSEKAFKQATEGEGSTYKQTFTGNEWLDELMASKEPSEGDTKDMFSGVTTTDAITSPNAPKQEKPVQYVGTIDMFSPAPTGEFPELSETRAEDNWKTQTKRLNSTDNNAIKDYTGYLHSPLNKMLRGIPPSNGASEYSKGVIDLDHKLEKALNKVVVPQNMTVYRGLVFTAGKDFHKKLGEGEEAVGKTYTESGYMSTSIRDSFARSWGSSAIINLKVPEGTHGAYVDPISQNSGENEYLFPKGGKITITKYLGNKNGEGTPTYEGYLSY